ncbi:vascular endothelial growth factor receptor 3 isoform X3 [Oncorhynchus mykiss]|uniref:vascular endothelial growth factor receptor 3 isoform X3 n=1 Tax=Oncorhynchus mykiss TaxID=8022 RepID=UPI001877B5A0|nr:vascular endothelial growth factor receptor 3 isoform X3 [Oncorhynchus mykiss]
MKRDLACFCRIWVGIVAASGLAIGYSMTPPTIDSHKEDLVIHADETLTITCRGQRTLSWVWPETTLVGEELTDRQAGPRPSRAPGREAETGSGTPVCTPRAEAGVVGDHPVAAEGAGTPASVHVQRRGVNILECPGEPGRPYCKTLVLTGAKGNDTGYYRCYYRDVKAVIDGTTAATLYVFVRDLEQPFLRRNRGSNGDLETIFISRSSTHVTVPCLVTVPDLNVTLYLWEMIPMLLEDEGMVWDSKRGWSIPRQTLDSRPFLIGIYCEATRQGRHYRSTLYLVQSTGSQVYDFKLYPEDSVELFVEEALTLNCTATVEFNTLVEFQWSYPGKQMNSTVGIVHKRNSLSRFTEAVSILTIQSVNVTDTGTYTCSAISVDKKMDLETQVIVYEKPFINLDYRSGPVVEATSGQKSFKLLVNVSAYPRPDIQWYKGDKLISRRPEFNRMRLHQHYNLEIRDVHPEDAGNYTVLLKNTASPLERRLTITLIINVPPQIHEKEIATPSNPYSRGSRQTLICTGYGLPAPNITWQWRAWSPCGLNSTQRLEDKHPHLSRRDRKGRSDSVSDCQNWQDLDSQNTVNKIENIETSVEVVDGRQKIVSRLVIQNASVSVMYKCTANNTVGKDQKLIYFYVTTIPEGFSVELGPSEEPLEQEEVSLSCIADNYTYEQLTWYRLDPQALQDERGKPLELDCRSVHLYADRLDGQLTYQEQSNSWVLEMTIASITLQDEGNYVCEVQNRRSREKHCLRKYISVQALEAPWYRHNPANQTLNISESLLMECDVMGTPSPHLSWFKDNQPLHQMSGLQLQDANRTLSIQRVREEDAGLYTCTACNQRGCADSSAAVTVLGSSDRANLEIMILIGTGVIAVFFWALLILIFCNVKRVNPADIKTGYLSIIMDPGEVPLGEQFEYLPYDSSQWEISMDKLQLGKVLGHGAFGKVIEASIFGISQNNSLDTVAVKMLKEGACASDHKALMSELKILIHIGNHLNVVNLLGACTKPSAPLMVVVEYCKYGNLSNYLRAKREFFLPYRDRSPKTQSQVRRMIEAGQVEPRARLPPSPSSSSIGSLQSQSPSKSNQKSHSPAVEKLEDLWKTPLTIEDLICYSFQVARGMEFLASRKCIHRDLAARNILLSENNVVKICDFGLARDIYKDPDYVRKGSARLPLKWMAPESIFDKVYTSQSDVWSFGVLLWEIFSLGASPYPGVQIDEDFCKRLKDGTRMRAPETASPEIYGIMLACWQGEPRERPPFQALVDILGDLLQDDRLPDGKDYIPLNPSQSSEEDSFSHASSRPASQEEMRLACHSIPIRYYNCVPFAGCVFVGPSKLSSCQPRVKTFEELPMETAWYKTHNNGDNQTDSGMVLASEEFEMIQHKHRGANSTERLVVVESSGSSVSSRHRPAFLSQLSGQTFYNNEYGQLSEEGRVLDFFSSPDDTRCLASSNL